MDWRTKFSCDGNQIPAARTEQTSCSLLLTSLLHEPFKAMHAAKGTSCLVSQTFSDM